MQDRNRAFDARERLGDPVEIVARQTVAEHPHLGVLVALLRRLHATQDDVATPETADLVLGLGAGALTDREHRDHARDTEQHAERRQEAAELVEQETRDS